MFFFVHTCILQCLDGPDPVSSRPELLYVKSRKFKRINVDQVCKQ